MVKQQQTLKRLLFVPDTHAPYHDETAWQTMMAGARVLKPDIVVVMGDLADFYAVSSHLKDPRRANLLKQELPEVSQKLTDLESLKPKRKVYLAGNHEYRLDRYIQDRAPALYGLTSWSGLLNLKSRGWEFVPYKDGIDIGKLYITHDLEQGGALATKRARDAVEGNVVIGHTHRMNFWYESDARRTPKVGASFGWLGDFEAVDYRHRRRAGREWIHGFGIGYMDREGHIYLQGIPIFNAQCCVNGQLIRAQK